MEKTLTMIIKERNMFLKRIGSKMESVLTKNKMFIYFCSECKHITENHKKAEAHKSCEVI
jgi:hypothetical protein